jgi:hypothetical protein
MVGLKLPPPFPQLPLPSSSDGNPTGPITCDLQTVDLIPLGWFESNSYEALAKDMEEPALTLSRPAQRMQQSPLQQQEQLPHQEEQQQEEQQQMRHN